ncbi:uncharacterized protein PV06_07891 [Exophiala oligosperma]|uniref:AB hydrolase-1 domain-containing protein n=1 Tax=Exophiala oligosperma TaxID=215243 RepID=A0A0D2DYT1_9EURO|nr:uncharacterized protein PV06_07891 [Exophiala oligosperma]KIW40714.1 hypothetical protein PV06_07891 [Exophiala oligosperma]
MSEISTYSLGDFALQSGETIPGAFIAYRTFGSPSNPAILYPTWFSGLISDNEWLVGTDKALDPNHYFIIIPALFGNGQSISPSNSSVSPFPKVSFFDNVRAQHVLVTEHLKVTHLRLVTGWSMGAAQSFQWATQYPSFMDVVVPFCGSARTSFHNQTMLEGVKVALLAAKGQSSAGPALERVEDRAAARPRDEWTQTERTVGLKAFGRAYAGWGFSQTFYRQRLHETAYGAKSLEDFLQTFWEPWALSKDPENLLTMLWTWTNGDVSLQGPYDGDFEKAMAAIKAKTLVLPSKTDLYFPPEDSEYEVSSMSPGVGTLDVYPSVWGHWAGGPPGNMEDVKWLDERLARLLAEAPKLG